MRSDRQGYHQASYLLFKIEYFQLYIEYLFSIFILDDLIEIGVDAIHPVQVAAAGMDPSALKKNFGDRLAFWGGMDTQQVLPRGSVEDVKQAVERSIEALGKGGGYILGAVHNIQPDVPLENILAMVEHARTYVPSFAG
jgi:uroporphyrinogen decarboxylase